MYWGSKTNSLNPINRFIKIEIFRSLFFKNDDIVKYDNRHSKLHYKTSIEALKVT